MAYAARKLSLDDPQHNVSAFPARPHLKLVACASGTSPRLTLAALGSPSYMVNANFEIEWCNGAAEERFLTPGQGLSNALSHRPLFASLFSHGPLANAAGRDAILAPSLAGGRARDAKLAAKIDSLRRAGETVIEELPGHARHRAELGCARELVKRRGTWVVQRIGKHQ